VAFRSSIIPPTETNSPAFFEPYSMIEAWSFLRCGTIDKKLLDRCIFDARIFIPLRSYARDEFRRYLISGETAVGMEVA